MLRSLPGILKALGLSLLDCKPNRPMDPLSEETNLCTNSSHSQRQTVPGSAAAAASARSVWFSQLSSWQLPPQENYLHLLSKVAICLPPFTGLQHRGSIHMWFDPTAALSVCLWLSRHPCRTGILVWLSSHWDSPKSLQNTCFGQDWVIQEGEKWKIVCRWGENYWLINFPF